MSTTELRLPALAIRQTPSRVLYSFAVDGKELPSFATVSRVQRDARQRLDGYQRAESFAHIRTIRQYLESAEAMLPNALVVAFDDRVRFEPAKGARGRKGDTQVGHLIVPVIDNQPDHEKPGWVVDGQQRCAAIRDADVEAFPVYVTAFITTSVAEQRSQFILVNSAKPLPKGLIHELLPATPEADLPVTLLKKRFPAVLLDRMNYDKTSPLYRRIRTPTTVEGTIKDNSILKLISMSIEDGALYNYFDSETGEHDINAMLELLSNFFRAVAAVFPEAWTEPPRRSRLVHGAGIVSLGCLMDEIAYTLRDKGVPTSEDFASELERVRGICSWTEGTWEFARNDRRRWNEIQNTPRDIRVLSEYLLSQYRAQVRDLAAAA